MYISDLEPRRIALDRLYLDPNNPRFPDRRGRVASKRIIEPNVQEKAQQRIIEYGIRELANSILRNGFLPLDRIVVTEIKEHPDHFVVVEGNRRLAALRTVSDLINNDEVDADDLTEEYLESILESIGEINCLVYIGSDTDIAWILQGIRHLSGIRDWSPAQKAELVVKEIDESQLKFRAVGEMLGMTANQVGKYYRAFKALEQMRTDTDFSDRFEKSFFTLFDEAYSKTAIRSWLSWDESQYKFTNHDKLHLFYSWITPDPEHNSDRRIHDPRQMRLLSRLVDPAHAELLQQFSDYEITIEQADARISGDVVSPTDWRDKVSQAEDALRHIPLMALEDTEELAEKLKELETKIKALIARVEAAENPVGAKS